MIFRGTFKRISAVVLAIALIQLTAIACSRNNIANSEETRAAAETALAQGPAALGALAQEGNAAAQFILAKNYQTGTGAPLDPVQAAKAALALAN